MNAWNKHSVSRHCNAQWRPRSSSQGRTELLLEYHHYLIKSVHASVSRCWVTLLLSAPIKCQLQSDSIDLSLIRGDITIYPCLPSCWGTQEKVKTHNQTKNYWEIMPYIASVCVSIPVSHMIACNQGGGPVLILTANLDLVNHFNDSLFSFSHI